MFLNGAEQRVICRPWLFFLKALQAFSHFRFGKGERTLEYLRLGVHYMAKIHAACVFRFVGHLLFGEEAFFYQRR